MHPDTPASWGGCGHYILFLEPRHCPRTLRGTYAPTARFPIRTTGMTSSGGSLSTTTISIGACGTPTGPTIRARVAVYHGSAAGSSAMFRYTGNTHRNINRPLVLALLSFFRPPSRPLLLFFMPLSVSLFRCVLRCVHTASWHRTPLPPRPSSIVTHVTYTSEERPRRKYYALGDDGADRFHEDRRAWLLEFTTFQQYCISRGTTLEEQEQSLADAGAAFDTATRPFRADVRRGRAARHLPDGAQARWRRDRDGALGEPGPSICRQCTADPCRCSVQFNTESVLGGRPEHSRDLRELRAAATEQRRRTHQNLMVSTQKVRKRQRTQGAAAAVPVPVAVPLQASPQAGVTIHRCSTGGTITGEQRLPPFLFSRTRCALHCCSRGPLTHRGAFSPDLRANPRRSDDQMEQEEVPGRGDSP